ncbi:MAG: SH3 domain-containing protein [Deltaproteobacteria bacterium]|nr:SH3 domain-containing protein [Deltaproteobacteria bacterium]
MMTTLKAALITSLVICLTGFAAFAAGNKVLSVQVKEGHIRATPSFLGQILTKLSYGEQVEELIEKGDWVNVKLERNDSEGWMHISALSRKKIVLKPGVADVEQAASSDEIALAGKGFNEQVEGEFKAGNRDLDFTWINKMERIVISQYQMNSFLEEGGLHPEGDTK